MELLKNLVLLLIKAYQSWVIKEHNKVAKATLNKAKDEHEELASTVEELNEDDINKLNDDLLDRVRGSR